MKFATTPLVLFPLSVGAFTLQHRRPITTTQLHAGVGVFFGTSTGTTETCAELIAEAIGSSGEPIDIDTIQGKLADEFANYDALIVGTPTWNTGADTERSGTGWDEVYYGEMQDLSVLDGKNVAVFGLGDSVSYAENYADGTGELHDIFSELGANMMGYVDASGYEYDESKALRDDNKFCGLLLDNVNFEELTEERITNWVAQLKEEGFTDGAASSVAETVAPTTSSATPTAAETATSTTSAPAAADAIAKLEEENFKLRQMLEENSTLMDQSIQEGGSNANKDEYTPHYNAVSGRTMWTSADGTTCYYTEASSKASP